LNLLELCSIRAVAFLVKFYCLYSPKEKTHPRCERMGSRILLGATPLPIIAGPEALRPTLSRGLPLSYYVIERLNEELEKKLG